MNSHRTVRCRFSKGFTLIELLVVIAIMGILAALAAPAMGGLIASYQTQSTAEQLSTLILRAQTEALRRSGFVQLERVDDCPSSNSSGGGGCAPHSDWSYGVELKVDEPKDNTFSLLLYRLDIPTGVQVVNNSTMFPNTYKAQLPFDRWGRVSTTNNPTFLVSKNDANVAVCLYVTGRVRVIESPPDLDAPCP